MTAMPPAAALAPSDLLARLKGMHDHLPPWLQVSDSKGGNAHDWPLPNGSRCLAFPTTAGDSYTASLAIVDEADLDRRMRSGELSLAIEIPPGFGRDMLRGSPVQIGAWIDGAMPAAPAMRFISSP